MPRAKTERQVSPGVSAIKEAPQSYLNGVTTFQAERDHAVVAFLKGWGTFILVALVGAGFLIRPATETSVAKIDERLTQYIEMHNKMDVTRGEMLENKLEAISLTLSDIAFRMRGSELFQAEMRGRFAVKPQPVEETIISTAPTSAPPSSSPPKRSPKSAKKPVAPIVEKGLFQR